MGRGRGFVVGISPEHIRVVIPTIAHLLEECTEGGRYTVEDLVGQIEARDRQAWLVMQGKKIRALALTQISAEQFKTCWITHVTGDGLREWADAYLEIEEWARTQGCAKIEAIARTGYARFGKQYGLRQTHVLLEKELT